MKLSPVRRLSSSVKYARAQFKVQSSKFKVQKLSTFNFQLSILLLLIFNFQFSIFNCVQAQKPRVATDTLRANVALFTPGIKITSTVSSAGVLKVATDGTVSWGQVAYSELSSTPAIPAAQIQSDWNQASTSAGDYIKNKPTSMSASDVYLWAKASTKPSYNAGDVGAAPASHKHTVSQIDGFPTIPAQLNLIQGTGITITGTYPNLTISCD